MSAPGSHVDVSASGQVAAGPGTFFGALLTAGAGAPALLVLYDNTSGSGTVLCSLRVPAGESAQWTPACGYVFSRGVYASITGAGAGASVVLR